MKNLLTFNQSAINHFLMKKFPKRIIGTNSRGVVLFLDRDIVDEYYSLCRQVIEDFLGYRFLGISFKESRKRLVVMVSNEPSYDVEKMEAFKELFETLIKQHFGVACVIFIVDYRRLYIDSKISEEDVRNYATTVLHSETRVVLPPMVKEARARVELMIGQYKHVKARSAGQYSSKHVIISYKK